MLIPYVLFGGPILALVYFAISLCLYISAKHKNTLAPGSVDDETMQQRKSSLTLAGVILLVFGGTLIGVMALLSAAIAYM